MQFNLALASMCNRQYMVGFREYQRGVRWAERERVHMLRRRGLLSLALADLREAVKRDRARLALTVATPQRDPSLAEAPEAIQVERLLEEAWKRTLRRERA
jgi:hypothetical protein